MNEFLSEEIPYNDIPHDEFLAIKILNSSDLSSFQLNSDANYAIQSTLANPISECLDVQLNELELNEICQDGENTIE
ncbi:unnamed protein product [Rhizophagus irregularis]|uniref:Uncharacterized protein n=1 Tax=Rhizophagus irregularis TaxID=588596 RepID=A0A915ZWK1_9GLOM|nr:unnamed protein product [Rhizophagus irregularis]